MKGILKMLTGQGGKEYGEQHRKFNDAIPDDFPVDWTIEERAQVHPAYGSESSDAQNYRRAHYMHGPQSKKEHAKLAARQRLFDEAEGSPVVRVVEWVKRQVGG